MAYTESSRPEPRRPISTLLVDLLDQLAGLARIEGQLARAEMSERVGEIGIGLGLVIGGAVLVIPALVILLDTLVAMLVAAGLQVRQASFAIGGATLVIGLVLFAVGVSRLKVRRLVPGRTILQLQRDAALASEQMRSRDDIRERAA